MNLPLQIGVTGGIGSGKSLVCRMFQSLGIPVYDADSRAKEVMTTDGILVGQIKQEFGKLSYDSAGNLDRGYLSKTVFGNAERLKLLNSLVHPRVALDYKEWLAAHPAYPYVIREAALLYEANVAGSLGQTIVVIAPEILRIQRVRERDPQRSEEDIRKIIDNQWPDEEKMKHANHIIRNDNKHLLIPQVLKLHEQFVSSH